MATASSHPARHRRGESPVRASVSFLLPAFVLAAVVAGCGTRSARSHAAGDGGAANESLQLEDRAAAPPAAALEPQMQAMAKSAANARDAVAASVAPLPPSPDPSAGGSYGARREIIVTGEMTLEVNDVNRSLARASDVATAAGGWVAGTLRSSPAEGVTETRLTLRIPAARFPAVHDSLARFGDVVYESSTSQDVGREFVDLEARAANSRREEQVIAALFARPGKIGDVLEVERELARVRGEIEQAEGQLRYYRDQVAYSTLALSLRSRRPALQPHVAGWNAGYHARRAWRMLIGFARTTTYAAIYAAILGLPLVLLLSGAALAIRRRVRAGEAR